VVIKEWNVFGDGGDRGGGTGKKSFGDTGPTYLGDPWGRSGWGGENEKGKSTKRGQGKGKDDFYKKKIGRKKLTTGGQ